MDRVILSVFSMVIFLFLALLGLFYFDKENREITVKDAVYDTVEVASTGGSLTESEFNDMLYTINKFSMGNTADGKFFVEVKLEDQIKPGTYDTFYESSVDRRKYDECIDSGKSVSQCQSEVPNYGDVIDRPLDIGDKITIYVRDNEETVFGKLMNTPIMGTVADQYVDSRMTVIHSGSITNSRQSVITGYEVIALINDNTTWQSGQDEIEGQSVNYSNTVVTVDTLISDEYETYNSTSYSEDNPSDPDYIFPDGKFEMDYRIEGNTRYYEFTQSY